MIKETSILLLSTMLLIQLAYCAPVKDDSSSSSSSEEDSDTIQRDRLLINMITGFKEFSDYTLDEKIKFARKLLDDEKLRSTKTENMEKFRQNITKIINDVDEITKVDKNKTPKEVLVSQMLAITAKAEIVSNFEDLLEWHDPEEVAEPTVDDYLIEKALIRTGSKKLEEDVEAKFDDFAKSFSKDVEEYINKLSSEEKVKDEKLIKWYENFKTEPDRERKLMKLKNFLPLFKIDTPKFN